MIIKRELLNPVKIRLAGCQGVDFVQQADLVLLVHFLLYTNYRLVLFHSDVA